MLRDKKFLAVSIVFIAGIALVAFFSKQRAPHPSQETKQPADGDGVRRIVLLGASPTIKLAFEGFRSKLDELSRSGDISTEYISLDIPFSETNIKNAVQYITDTDAHMIVTGQSEIPLLTKTITATPIIALLASDPVAAGLAKSESGSGNNVVFMNSGNHANTGRRLEFFLELAPKTRTVLVPRGDATVPGEIDTGMVRLRETAVARGITLVEKRFSSRQEMNKFFLEYDFSSVDAIFRYPSTFIAANIDLLFAFQASVKKPIIVLNREELIRGGTLAYGPRYKEIGEEGALVAWQIFKGQAEPATTPVIRPFRNELGVNESVARELGLDIPELLLQKADYVVQ